jgi:hypothetical protein
MITPYAKIKRWLYSRPDKRRGMGKEIQVVLAHFAFFSGGEYTAFDGAGNPRQKVIF